MQYFEDIDWKIIKYSMDKLKNIEITSIQYDPAIVMTTNGMTTIAFRTPDNSATNWLVRYLMIDFPADIWGSML